MKILLFSLFSHSPSGAPQPPEPIPGSSQPPPSEKSEFARKGSRSRNALPDLPIPAARLLHHEPHLALPFKEQKRGFDLASLLVAAEEVVDLVHRHATPGL